MQTIPIFRDMALKGTVPLRPPISPLANGATLLANKVPLPDGGSPLANFLEL